MLDPFADERITKVFTSDCALDLLLTRLKQLMVTCDEFAKFTKKKAAQAEDYYHNLRKQAKHSADNMAANAQLFRDDSFTAAFREILAFDEKLYNVGHPYVQALSTMADELGLLVMAVLRKRKALKEDGKRVEKECMECIGAAEKARGRYNHLCMELDKLRTTDPNKKKILSSKTNAQQEDELTRKIEAADSEYQARVNTAKARRQELVAQHRPRFAKLLKNLILETDIALNIQLQKYVTWSETLIINSGVLVLPVGGASTGNKPGMKEIVNRVDNDADLFNYVLTALNAPPNRNMEVVEYKVHPTLANSRKPSGVAGAAVTGTGFLQNPPPQDTSFSVAPSRPLDQSAGSPLAGGALKGTGLVAGGSAVPTAGPGATFGVPLSSLAVDCGLDNVPFLVERCITLVDKYGLGIVGLYRTSSSAVAVRQLREVVDTQASDYYRIGEQLALDGSLNPTEGEVLLVANILKAYFQALPQPLILRDQYTLMVDAMRTAPDEQHMRHKFHQLVYQLADAEYFTLRLLIFHLVRVAAASDVNKMNAHNLGLVWGATLMPHDSPSLEESELQAKIIETLMAISGEIFEPEL